MQLERKCRGQENSCHEISVRRRNPLSLKIQKVAVGGSEQNANYKRPSQHSGGERIHSCLQFNIVIWGLRRKTTALEEKSTSRCRCHRTDLVPKKKSGGSCKFPSPDVAREALANSRRAVREALSKRRRDRKKTTETTTWTISWESRRMRGVKTPSAACWNCGLCPKNSRVERGDGGEERKGGITLSLWYASHRGGKSPLGGGEKLQLKH